MQMITWIPESQSSSKCDPAVAPVVYQSANIIATGSGDTADVLVDLGVGAAAYYGGQITVRGCSDVLVEVNYIDGDDCDVCTATDTLSLAPRSFIVPANSAFPMPDGFWQDLQITAVDGAGVAQNVTSDVSVNIYSAYKPACPDCAVLAI